MVEDVHARVEGAGSRTELVVGPTVVAVGMSSTSNHRFWTGNDFELYARKGHVQYAYRL